jgi:DNA primase
MVKQEIIEQVRNASDIVEVISEYLELKKTGRNFKARCPFHSEKTPSFMVSPEKQVYHCFGCGAGGNVFTFIMEQEKISFPEALRALAERAGIEIPDSPDDRSTDKVRPLYDALEASCRYYQGQLRDSRQGKPAREYLTRRGLSSQMINDFRLGYAPPGWENLLSHLNRSFNPNVLVAAGLSIRREGSGHYDRFRDRIMFPVTNTLGKVVGYGARTLQNEEPKYLNSPDGAIYSKSYLLYGLSQSKDDIRSEGAAVAVEGYTDFLSLYQNGVRNVVATSGTAFTEGHGKLLSRFCENVFLCYDSDEAGTRAAARAAEPLLRAGLDIRVILLPKGEDPDSFARDQDATELKARLFERAVSLVDFLIRRVPGRTKSEILRDSVGYLAQVPDAIKRRCLIQELAEKTAFDEQVLADEVEKRRHTGKPYPAGKKTSSAPPVELPKPESEFLALCLEFPDILEKSKELLEPLDFSDERSRKIWLLLREAAAGEHAVTIQQLVERAEAPETAALISGLTFCGVEEIEQAEKAGIDFVGKLKEMRLRREIERLSSKLKEEKEEKKIKILLKKKQELVEELRGWRGM